MKALCVYAGCTRDAAFDCTCTGEGTTEKRALCEHHKKRAEVICALFGWQLVAVAIADGRPS